MPKKSESIEPINGNFEDVTTTIVSDSRNRKNEAMPNQDNGRIHEKDVYIPALRLANDSPGGFIKTSDLITELELLFNVVGQDATILEGRSDTYFSQKIRNLISHRESDGNIIRKGYAEYDKEKREIQITVEGRRLLESLDD